MNRRDIRLVLLTSIGLILSYPPFPTGFIASVAMVPFFFFMKEKRVWEAMRGGYIVGVIWAAGTLYWIGWATVIGLVGAMIWLGLPFAFFAGAQSWLEKRWGMWSYAFAPLVWTCVEIVFSWGPMGFTWNSLANTQTYYPVLIQYASVTGQFGVTFWVVSLNVLFFFLFSHGWKKTQSSRLAAAILLMYVIPLGYGCWLFSHPQPRGDELKISLVQGNIDPYKKWSPAFIDSNFTVYHRLTAEAADFGPNLVVWPETAAPTYLRHRFRRLRQVKSQLDSLGIPLLTGAPDYRRRKGKKPEVYNSAFLIHPDSWRMEAYSKIHLVPFGEKVPLVGKFPVLYDLARKTHLDVGGFASGDSVVVFRLRPPSKRGVIRFSTIICYESIFPYLVRRFIKGGARFLVIVTNDGWFGHTSGPYQHAQIAVLRAIENRTWIARCANTGISELIDPMGRIRSRTRFNEEAILSGTIETGGGDSLFVRYGNVSIYLILILSAVVFTGTAFVKKK